ncbi:hypothetical protein BT67DRAFT_9723 [Trichocladium antarcticum]|uniref:BAG domain-containing protein n=1 Tax=Trichocladium antarcticum TaxID=1450529 RepID=A0AAN6UTP9_9PEZI|nr:hypothetical protein BT67DRAFT_9723 [Trichocladium antarcticum]
MRRYGFSSRGTPSPFGSTLGQGVPNVTDEDFSYITSADLEDRGVDIPGRPYIPRSHFMESYSHSAPPPSYAHRPEDDVILVKHNGITYPEHFPAYSIGDGKLLVGDVRERVNMILDLSERQAKRVKLFYKGRRLKDPDAPVRQYGVKNSSELLMTIGESSPGAGSDSGEEVIVVGRDRRPQYDVQQDYGRPSRTGGWGNRSPRDSGPLRPDIPVEDSRRRAASRVRTQSPSGGSNVSTASAPPGALSSAPVPTGRPGGPIEKLNAIAADFNSRLKPMCVDFITRPPRDPKKRIDEHRRISETIMEHVILKFDAIETSEEEGARERRRELVRYVQAILKDLDDAKL